MHQAAVARGLLHYMLPWLSPGTRPHASLQESGCTGPSASDHALVFACSFLNASAGAIIPHYSCNVPQSGINSLFSNQQPPESTSVSHINQSLAQVPEIQLGIVQDCLHLHQVET